MKRFVRCVICLAAAAVLFCGVHPAASAEYGDPCAHSHTAVLTETVLAASCTEEGSRFVVTVCTDCGEELKREAAAVPALGHEYGELLELRAAACTASGALGYVCARCGDQIEEELIPPLDHEYADGVCIHCGQALNGVSSWAGRSR